MRLALQPNFYLAHVTRMWRDNCNEIEMSPRGFSLHQITRISGRLRASESCARATKVAIETRLRRNNLFLRPKLFSEQNFGHAILDQTIETRGALKSMPFVER